MKKFILALTVIVASLGTSFSTQAAVTTAPGNLPSKADQALHLGSFHALVQSKLAAVVSVIATKRMKHVETQQLPPGVRDFLKRFFGPNGPNQRSPGAAPHATAALGSGFIIDPDGYIVTNDHVVRGAQSVRVVLRDETEFPAKVVGADVRTDLALLKVKADHPLPHLDWDNSDRRALVGDWVLAIGNPFGLGGTVTAGIVSARARNIHEGPYDEFIQTDAAINRGNSGGPLIDVDGKVVGVNTAIFSPNGGNIGIGFAVPSAVAQPIIHQLRTSGTVVRGWLGVNVQNVTPNLAKAMGMDEPKGALVSGLTKDSPAAKAGIKVGDVILDFNGTKITRLHDLPRAVADAKIGSKAKVVLLRDGERITVNPKIARLKEKKPTETANNRPQSSPRTGKLGLALAPLTSKDRSALGIGADVQGALIARVKPGSPAGQQGLRPGDVILRAGSKNVKSPEDVVKAVRHARKDKRGAVEFLLQRNHERQFVAIPLTAQEG